MREWRMEDGGWRMEDGGWRMEEQGEASTRYVHTGEEPPPIVGSGSLALFRSDDVR